MIERFHLKNHLLFREVTLTFDKNFIVFTGPSGAGKSVLMDALLALFGLKECDAAHVEATLDAKLDLAAYGIEEDDPNIFRLTKGKATRFFINNQQISRKNIREISKTFIHYLSLREMDEFENENLLRLLDAIASKQQPEHTQLLQRFHESYHRFKEVEKALTHLQEEEKKIEELKEFTTFEIEKIEKISPSPDEYEKLMEQKKALSKKEKIEASIEAASQIFQIAPKVSEALQLLEEESTFFDDTLTRLEAIFEGTHEKLSELEDIDIEALLDRIEQLSALKRKHGSIEAALEYLDQKRKELDRYENLSFEKEELEKRYHELHETVHQYAQQLTQNRTEAIKILQSRVEHYLNLLYLEKITFTLEQKPLGEHGSDHVNVHLKNTDLKKISAGEMNRLRLAMLAAENEFVRSRGGVLILDEIDANVSGKESTSIATVLRALSQNYQIFAISHQPQLSSEADMHFLVHKEKQESRVEPLDTEGRIKELSRMISAEEITDEAITFARSLLARKG